MLYHLTLFQTFYLFLYILLILYSALLGFWMFSYKECLDCTPGEMVAKRRMSRAVGALMFLWTFDLLIYLIPMLCANDFYGLGNKVCFLITMVHNPPIFYVVMRAILQKWTNVERNACFLGLPFLLIGLWYVVAGQTGLLALYVAGCLNVLCIVSLLLWHVRDYRNYIICLRSEYSETTNMDIFWSWWSFLGIAVQFTIFVVYQVYWNVAIEFIYTGLSIANAAFICYCTHKQKPMDGDIVIETGEEIPDMNTIVAGPEEGVEDKAFYSIVEQKLESVCKNKELFLEPDLTRDSLCQQLCIGRTYLSMYLRSRGITFYQYINTLRVEYAIKLMQEHPEMPIREVSNLSGFRSQTTFRKVFLEVKGHLPSKMKFKDN